MRSMQHVLEAIRSVWFRSAKMRSRTRAARPKTWNPGTFFYILYFMHVNAVWQSSLKISARYWHSQQILHSWSSYKILINALFVISLFGWPSALAVQGCRLVHPTSAHPSLVTTLCNFYRCSKSMRNVALYMHCERWIPFQLWRNYKMIKKS